MSAAERVQSPLGRERDFWAQVALLTLLGLAARAAYVAWFAPPVAPMTDASGYYQMGRIMAAGHGYLRWSDFAFRGVVQPTVEYAPLFPALLALLRLFGIESIEAQRATVALLGTANVPLIAWLGRRIARALGDESPRLPLIAAAAAAVAPALVANDAAFMREALYVPLVLAATGCLAVASLGQKEEPVRGSWVWFGAGLLLGLAALTRSEAQMLVLLLGAPLCWLAGALRRRAAALALAAGLALVVLPWTARNWIVLDEFVPISTNYKGAIGGANCPATYQPSAYYGAWWFGCIQAVDVTGLSEFEMSNRYRDAGMAFALAHPEAWPRVVTARLLRTWGLYAPGRWFGQGEKEIRNPHFDRRTWWVGWLLLATLPFGAWRIARASPVAAWLVLAPVVMVSVTSVIGYGNPRFRAAAEPSLLLSFAALLSYGIARLGPRNARELEARESTR